jgi:hypothetical protein
MRYKIVYGNMNYKFEYHNNEAFIIISYEYFQNC